MDWTDREQPDASRWPELISFSGLPKLIGIPASPGVAIGKVHPLDRRRARVPRYHIVSDQVAADDLPTADAAVLLSGGRVRGLVTDFGSKTSHTAILARALEVPAVVGAGQASELCRAGDSIALDGNTGEVLISPDPADLVRFET